MNFIPVFVVCLLVGVSLCHRPAPRTTKDCRNWTTPEGIKKWKCNIKYIYPNKHWSWRTVYSPDGIPRRVYEEKYSFDDNEPEEVFTPETTTITTTTLTTEAPEEDDYVEEDNISTEDETPTDDNLSLDTCGMRNLKRTGGGRIVGGRPALRNEFPWMVGVEHGENNDFAIRGGGAIINKRWIITAAHVFQPDQKVDNYRGIIDTVTLNEAPIYVYFDQLLFHPDYKNTTNNYYNDIALLHTTKDMALYPKRDGVNSICLPEENKNYEGIVTVSGFGTTDEDGTPTDRLMTADLEILNDNICRKQFQKQFKSRIMICAGSSRNRKDSCRGDSGGPMIRFENEKAYIIGVVSYGGYAMCGRVGTGAVYTKVSQYIQWIQSNTKNV